MELLIVYLIILKDKLSFAKTTTMKNLLLIFFLLPSTIIGQVENSTDSIKLPSIFDFFIEKEIIEITLEAEFDSILNSKKFNQYLDGKLSFKNKENTKRNIPIRVKQRGKYRRRICEFPPLKLKFEKKYLTALQLNSDFNDLKLITHCIDDRYQSKENLLREYLAYKLFEFHSEKHFRVHLVKINYKVPSEKRDRFQRYGILLEEDKNVAKRLGGKIFDAPNCTIDKMNHRDLKINAVYQFMIGNSDWDPVMVRNIKLIQKDSLEKLNVVPYDFDFSGLVNAPYAKPNPNFKLTSVRDRVMQCKFESEEELQKVATLFLDKKETVLDFCKNFKALPRASRFDIKEYLLSFYSILENEALRKQTFMIQENPSTSN